MTADCVIDQIESVLADLPVAAVKTGMLGSYSIVAAVAQLAGVGRLPQLVVDPVMAAQSGDMLVDDETIQGYIDLLLPLATVATPNILEAQLLLGQQIRTRTDQAEAAREIGSLGPRFVLVTGGRALPDDPDSAVDVFWNGSSIQTLRAERIDTRNTHGSGCTLAAAVAAGMAHGASPGAAISRAKVYLGEAIQGGAAWALGRGAGPLDHFLWNLKPAEGDA